MEIIIWIVLLLGVGAWLANLIAALGDGDWLNWLVVIILPITSGLLLFMYLRAKRMEESE